MNRCSLKPQLAGLQSEWETDEFLLHCDRFVVNREATFLQY